MFSAQGLRDDYIGNGAIVNFGFNFPVYTEDDIQVILDGVVQTKTTHYTVRNAADTANFSTLTAAQLPATGIIKFITAPAVGKNVNLIPLQAAVQSSDYVVEPFPADRVEKDLDKMVMLVRTLREQMRRVFKFATKSLKVDADGAADDPVVGKFLRAKDPGPGLEWATPANITASLPLTPANGGTGTGVVGVAKGDILAGRAGGAFDRRAVGADGQVLTADSLQIDGVKWAALTDPGAIQKSIVTAKGDIIGATAASTPVRIAIGANGRVLMGSSGDVAGVRWAGAGELLRVDAVTGIGSPADTLENTLKTYTLPANMLATNGDMLRLTFGFRTAANATTKRIRIYFGTAVILDSTAIAHNGQGINVTIFIARTGAVAQYSQGTAVETAIAIGTPWSTAVTGGVSGGFDPAQNLAAAVVIKATVTLGVGAALNDVIQDYMIVELLPTI